MRTLGQSRSEGGLTRVAAGAVAVGAGLAGAMVPTGSHAQVPVDQMSCSAAVAATRQQGAYWKKTGFGLVSIRPFRTVGPGPANCPARFTLSFFVERTQDNPACVLGYSCVERVRLRN